jgi:hypothetical protein
MKGVTTVANKLETAKSIKPGDDRFNRIVESAMRVIGGALEAGRAEVAASEAAKAAREALGMARGEAGNARINAALALCEDVRRETNGLPLGGALVGLMVDAKFPAIKSKDDPGYATRAKDRSVMRATLECATMARHAKALLDNVKANHAEACEGKRDWDVFVTALRACRDTAKGGVPFEATTPDAVVSRFKARAAKDAEGSGGEGGSLSDMAAAAPFDALRIGVNALETQGAPAAAISAIQAAMVPIATWIAARAAETQAKAPETVSEPAPVSDNVSSLLDDMGLMA